MCRWCGRADCTLTKKQALQHGPILEMNVAGMMRLPFGEYPGTYYFKGVPAYYSVSALIPDENEENPHAYLRFLYDEDENAPEGWECREVLDPLSWKTEAEIQQTIFK